MFSCVLFFFYKLPPQACNRHHTRRVVQPFGIMFKLPFFCLTSTKYIQDVKEKNPPSPPTSRAGEGEVANFRECLEQTQYLLNTLYIIAAATRLTGGSRRCRRQTRSTASSAPREPSLLTGIEGRCQKKMVCL